MVSRGNEVVSNLGKYQRINDMFIVDFMRSREQALGMTLRTTCNIEARSLKRCIGLWLHPDKRVHSLYSSEEFSTWNTRFHYVKLALGEFASFILSENRSDASVGRYAHVRTENAKYVPIARSR